MDIGKALTMAKQLKNHFRVFEELDEFMREAVALQNVVKEFESRKAGLQEDIETLDKERAEHKRKWDSLLNERKAKFDAMMKSLDEKLFEREKEVNAEIEEMEGKEGKVKASLDMAYMLHKDEVERMKVETVTAEATLKAVENKIEDIKAKLE